MRYKSCVVLFALLAVAASPAFAADLPVKAPAAAEPVEYGTAYVGVDASTNNGLAGYAGVVYAPGGTDKSGIRLSAFGLYGKYKYTSDDATPTTFDGRFASGDFLVGYSKVWETASLTFSAGINVQNQYVTPADPNNSVQGTRAGLKIQSDFWSNPTERTLVMGIASFSTAFNTYYSIGRFGYDFFGKEIFIGPEVTALGNERTDQQRLGLHITGIPITSKVKLTLSGGWQRETNERDAGYATATLDYDF